MIIAKEGKIFNIGKGEALVKTLTLITLLLIFQKMKFIFLFIIIIQWYSFQNSGIDANNIKSALLTWYKNYPQEKIYLQTNQSAFAAGETIWFKVYASAYNVP